MKTHYRYDQKEESMVERVLIMGFGWGRGVRNYKDLLSIHNQARAMQEFMIMIYRDLTSKDPKPSPQEMKEAIKPYLDWISGIKAQDKLIEQPKRWDLAGRVIRRGKTSNDISIGPFTNGRESIGGLIHIRSKDYDEAVGIAEGCPLIEYGAVVEVRMANPTD